MLEVVGDLTPTPVPPHQRVPHWDIGTELGILDLERAVKISGSMFTMFRGPGATLARALCQLALDRNSDAYEEIRPPDAWCSPTRWSSTGQLPKFADDAYHLERDDLWAIPTAEVPLTSLAMDEILDEAELPLRLMAYTPCFRREAGSAGRDTRGLLRVHEFDKVELLAYATPDQPPTCTTRSCSGPSASSRDLGLAYRILDICTGDMGNSAARRSTSRSTRPGVDKWLEVSSVSWFSDYQARRANIRYRPARRARSPRWCTPSTARPSPCPGCGPRWSRPIARPTARFACPRCCSRTCAARPPSRHERPGSAGVAAGPDQRPHHARLRVRVGDRHRRSSVPTGGPTARSCD